MNRIIQMMDAVTLRRPVEIVSQNLPPLKNEIYQYASDSAYTASSNHCFKEFKQRNESEEQESCWPWFDKARQYVYHYMLVQLHDIETRTLLVASAKPMTGDGVVPDQYRKRIASGTKQSKRRITGVQSGLPI